jgi:hypothetical protein
MNICRHIIGLSLLPLLAQGQQNLVPNSSFEEMVSCPTTAGQWWNTENWMNPNEASPDYFHVCNPPIYVPIDNYFPHLGVPANTFGFQEARTGVAYMGIYMFHRTNINQSEYIQVELTESLMAGVRYLVGFYVSLADDSNYALSTIGAYLSEEQISAVGYARFLQYQPQVENPYGNTLADKEIWVLVQDTVTSRFGDERFLTIGNFRTDLESDTVHQDTVAMGNRYAYYYIDDVSVVALDSIPNSIEDQAEDNGRFSVYPNPNNGRMTLQHKMQFGSEGTVSLYSLVGERVYEMRLQSSGSAVQLQLDGLSTGLYLLRVDVDGRQRFAAKVAIVRE